MTILVCASQQQLDTMRVIDLKTPLTCVQGEPQAALQFPQLLRLSQLILSLKRALFYINGNKLRTIKLIDDNLNVGTI